MDTPGAIRTTMKVLSLTSWPSRVVVCVKFCKSRLVM